MNSTLRTVARNTARGVRLMSGPPGAHQGDHKASMELWRKLTFLVAFPAIGLGMANAYINHEGHDRPEFIAYDYLRVRTKRFPWGDGNHSLFHNPHVNALPDGYEEDGGHH